MKLTNTQQNAVNELVNEFDPNNKNIVYFKAPTGSGKTFMIANVINDIVKKYFGENLLFVVATLSSAELPQQMKNNLEDYKYYLDFGTYLNIEKVDSPSNSKTNNKSDATHSIIAEKNKVLIFGTSSFGKNKIFTEEGVFDAFIDQIENEEYKLVYIRDEAHYGGETNTAKSKYLDLYNDNIENEKQISSAKDEAIKFEARMQQIAQYVIKMTATPNNKQFKQIVISDKDLEQDNIKLLKPNYCQNEDIKSLGVDTLSNKDILEIACNKFKEVKAKYIDKINEPSLVGINPAMLIQVRNKHSNEITDSQFDEEINQIISIVKSKGLTYAIYFGDDKFSNKFQTTNIREKVDLKSISQNNSDIDVIIFKIGPATGWNIPRACMLVQLRNVSSDTLNVQTIGRIRRNPNPSFPDDELIKINPNSISKNYYVYSNYEKKNREWSYYILQDKFKQNIDDFKFYNGQINRNILKETANSKKYNDEILSLIDKKQILNYINNELEYEYNKTHKLIATKEEIKDNNGNYVWREKKSLRNAIELEMYINDMYKIHQNYVSETTINNVNSKINKWWNSLESTEKIYSKNLIWYAIFKLYLNDIKKLHQKTIQIRKKENSNLQEFELINTKKLPSNSYQWNTSNFIDMLDNSDIKTTEKELNYAYLNSDNKSNKHYLDSNPEQFLLNKIKDEFKELYVDYVDEPNKFNEEIKIWTKNPTLHGINYEYYENEYEIKNSFPDIIIKYKTHQLIIEVKQDNDDHSNNDKINNLLNAYKKYIDEKRETLVSDDLTLSVALVSPSPNEKVRFKGYSTKQEINEYLNGHKESSFHTFFKKIQTYTK
ncbi:DEAD/DEAH box helicase family protein [Metamycoplasma salivarium]|uniref:DEAD/DEAH box helicase family protein n=1 Tax=Metamycoplasma salivarium TaxID=2124 RepID=UPI0035BBBF53